MTEHATSSTSGERIDAGGTHHRKAHDVSVDPDFCSTCWETWPCSKDMVWLDA